MKFFGGETLIHYSSGVDPYFSDGRPIFFWGRPIFDASLQG